MVKKSKDKNFKASDVAQAYSASWQKTDTGIWDIQINKQGRVWFLGAGQGKKREKGLLQRLEKGSLPVFLGSGLGVAIEEFARKYQGPFAVVDKESAILDLTACRQKFSRKENLIWLEDSDPELVLRKLTQWQMQHKGKKMVPLGLPLYQRLDRDYYHYLYSRLNASRRYSFWSKAKYEKFKTWPPRILLLTSKYFLMGEVQAGLKSLGFPFQMVTLGDNELGCEEFVHRLLKEIIDFQPDFILTVNHLGIDKEGILIELLEQMHLPLASWFVDNPHLILYLYNKVISPWTMIFTWDSDTLQSVRDLGFEHVSYLPLATDIQRFYPGLKGNQSWQAEVSFLGNSMVFKVGARMNFGRFPKTLLRNYKELACAFKKSTYGSVSAFLKDNHPEMFQDFLDLGSIERKLAFETMLTWEATRQYRYECLQELFDFDLLIVGDRGWKIQLARETRAWRYHPELNYYSQVPAFYAQSSINFNCTSQQMKGAVNQRVFDVPASGSFLLSDYRAQIESLFDLDTEVICYNEPGEIKELVKFYLQYPQKRSAIISAGRKRVLAEHTYDKRLKNLSLAMYRAYTGN